MPIYDFRCAECRAEREVRATYAVASQLELVCVVCGGAMTKTFTRSFVVASTPSLPSAAGSATPSKRHTHADDVVKLTRPNPFKDALATMPGSTRGE